MIFLYMLPNPKSQPPNVFVQLFAFLSAFLSTGYHSNGVLVFCFFFKSEQIAGWLRLLYFQFIISGIHGTTAELD